MPALTVNEICTRLGVRPQAVNAWVRKDGLKVVSDKPRTIDWDYLQEWLSDRESKPRKRREKDPGFENEEVDTRADRKVKAFLDAERRLLAWGRGDGKGWALARPIEEVQPLDNYFELISHDNRLNPVTSKKFLEEMEAGKLWFLDPLQALVLILNQLAPLAREKDDPTLDKIVTDLTQVIKELDQWKLAHRE